MHEKYPEGKRGYREFNLGTVHVIRRLIEFPNAGEVTATLEHRTRLLGGWAVSEDTGCDNRNRNRSGVMSPGPFIVRSQLVGPTSSFPVSQGLDHSNADI